MSVRYFSFLTAHAQNSIIVRLEVLFYVTMTAVISAALCKSELVRRASREGDEEELLALTKRINQLLQEQEQEENRRSRNDAA